MCQGEGGGGKGALWPGWVSLPDAVCHGRGVLFERCQTMADRSDSIVKKKILGRVKLWVSSSLESR